MYTEQENSEINDGSLNPAAGFLKTPSLAAILICAALSVVFMNFGLLSLFFLVPLGYAIIVSGSVWLPVFATALVNILFKIAARAVFQNASDNLGAEIFFFTAMFICFAWVIGSEKYAHIRTAYRFILMAVAATICFLGFFMRGGRESIFETVVTEHAETLILIVSSATTDAARRALLEQSLTPELLVEMIRAIFLRGGIIASMFSLFFVSRHFAFLFIRLIKKQERKEGLAVFFAPRNTIWGLSCSLAVIFVSRFINADVFQIIAWNVLVICGILFMAQGGGIVMHLLANRPYIRILVTVLFVFVLFSPLSIFFVTGLVILGIIENWVPIRHRFNNKNISQN